MLLVMSLGLFLVQCSSVQKEFQLLGIWQGFSEEDGYYEVVIDDANIHVHSSIHGPTSITYVLRGDSIIIGDANRKSASFMKWINENQLQLLNAKYDESIFRLPDSISTHMDMDNKTEVQVQAYLAEFTKRGEEFVQANALSPKPH
jgi:hypothetical protein